MTPERADPFEARPETDGYARRRFRGQGKRGKLTTEASHVIDIRLAIGELDAAREMLGRDDLVALTPIDRRENRKAAIAKVALAARALDELLVREDLPPPDCAPIRPARRRRGVSTP